MILNYIKTISSLLCMIGSIWQMYDMSIIYFKYETTVEVIKLPAMTVAFDLLKSVKLNYMQSRFPGIKSWQELIANFRNLSIREQHLATESTYNLVSCEVMTPKGLKSKFNLKFDIVSCDQVSPRGSYITFHHKYITFFSQSKYQSDDRFIIDYNSKLGDCTRLIKFRLRKELLPPKPLFLHSRRVLPYKSYYKLNEEALKLDVSNKSKVEISFTKTSMRLLPPPYTTSYKDYTQFGLYSRCKANQSITHLNGWHWDIIADEQVNVSFASLNKVLSYNLTTDQIQYKLCLDVCGHFPDCHSEYYQMNVMQVISDKRYFLSPVFEVDILPYNGLNTKYTHSPNCY